MKKKGESTNKEHNKDNFMLYIPKKKHDRWEVKKGKVYLIFEHNKAIEKLIRWLVKKPYISDMELDEMGSSVWLMIDDKKSVYDIGQELVRKFGKTCEPVYERLILYLRYLNRRGWIAFERGEQTGESGELRVESK